MDPLLSIRVKGIDNILKMGLWASKFDEVIRRPSHMTIMLGILGRDLTQNFSSEGAFGNRRWQSLSLMTQDLREQRGYPREHPILVQTGELRRITTLSFQYMKGDGSWQNTDRGGSTVFVASWSGSTMTASIAGDKVENNSGGTLSGMTTRRGKEVNMTLPPRPFFFIPRATNDEMFYKFNNSIMLEWRAEYSGKMTIKHADAVTIGPDVTRRR